MTKVEIIGLKVNLSYYSYKLIMQAANKVVVIEDYKDRIHHFYINISEREAQERFLRQGGYMPRQDFSETMNVFECTDSFSIDSYGQVRTYYQTLNKSLSRLLRLPVMASKRGKIGGWPTLVRNVPLGLFRRVKRPEYQ